MLQTKDRILDAAQQMFLQQGFDRTSIAQILEATQIARGTLYYYFSSKEEIMDAVIERFTEAAFAKAELAANKQTLSIFERLLTALSALNLSQLQDPEIIRQLSEPQNALLHEKSNQLLLDRAPRILLPIIEEGIARGEMKTAYPADSIELMLVYSLQVFGSSFQQRTPEEKAQKLESFLYLMERIFQTEKGYFDGVKQLIG